MPLDGVLMWNAWPSFRHTHTHTQVSTDLDNDQRVKTSERPPWIDYTPSKIRTMKPTTTSFRKPSGVELLGKPLRRRRLWRLPHVWVFDTNIKQAMTNRVSADQNRREWWSNHTPMRYRNPYAKPPDKMKTSSTGGRSDD